MQYYTVLICVFFPASHLESNPNITHGSEFFGVEDPQDQELAPLF